MIKKGTFCSFRKVERYVCQMPLRISYSGESYNEMDWVCCDRGYPALDCIENGGRVDFRFVDDYIFGDEDNVQPVICVIVNNNTNNLVGLKIAYYYLLWGENYWFCKIVPRAPLFILRVLRMQSSVFGK